MSGHVSSMNRTFIVEDDAEDYFVQWAKNVVTGEQGYIDDERSCFWTWDDTEYPEWWPGEDFAWCSKGKKGKKGLSKGNDAFASQIKAQRIIPRTKAR